ncbi:tetratricopeptide repeat protein 8-like isoform X5 [Varroa destructor]|uniref:Tetratricopeptide repeat protein 8 n=1 Tax=Varroa destructor TaxID=109461 RepID=A0A7M7M7J9_VARDE|nr:tetratricopeptide repeat protein 8-like isoform X5 [Varroa destructor]
MTSVEVDPLCRALYYYRQLKFDKCVECCEKAFEKNPCDQAAWALKAMALTRMVHVDDLEIEEEGIAEILLDDNAIAQVARPGTSLRTSSSAQGANPLMRPMSQSGRPITGMVRSGAEGAVGSIDAALKTARTAMSARPVTSSSGRYVRMGTASMLSETGEPFINVARLNISKYSQQPALAKALFNYIYYHENEVRHGLELATQATQNSKFQDWWWKLQMGKCYYRLSMFRDAEKQFRCANTQQPMVETALWLGKLFIRLDQPLAALELYRTSLEIFPNDTFLLTATARIHEGLNDLSASVKFYKDVLRYTTISHYAVFMPNNSTCQSPVSRERFNYPGTTEQQPKSGTTCHISPSTRVIKILLSNACDLQSRIITIMQRAITISGCSFRTRRGSTSTLQSGLPNTSLSPATTSLCFHIWWETV